MFPRAVVVAGVALATAATVPIPLPGDPATGPLPGPSSAPAPVPHLDAVPRRGQGAPTTTWVVTSGDNLWRIAAELTDRGSVAAVASYWQRLIAANREGLISGDPDLIYPGEVLDLPPVSS